MKRNPALAIGIAATLASAWLWHGPSGAGDRLTSQLAHQARTMLDHYEMQQVAVSVERAPLSRRLLLGGPADAFQRSEITRMSEEIPGVADARWPAERRTGGFVLPLLAEAMLLSLASFAVGVILAYVAALRRRAREAILA
jgi:hypothetical protein